MVTVGAQAPEGIKKFSDPHKQVEFPRTGNSSPTGVRSQCLRLNYGSTLLPICVNNTLDTSRADKRVRSLDTPCLLRQQFVSELLVVSEEAGEEALFEETSSASREVRRASSCSPTSLYVIATIRLEEARVSTRIPLGSSRKFANS